jgi:hypothetical protein
LAIACSSASSPRLAIPAASPPEPLASLAQLQLFLRQALGPSAKVHPRQLQQQMAQPVILRQ